MHAPITRFAVAQDRPVAGRPEAVTRRHFIVIAPNEAPMSFHAESWLVALGLALQESGQTGPMEQVRVTKCDGRTWQIEDIHSGRRYVIVDTV